MTDNSNDDDKTQHEPLSRVEGEEQDVRSLHDQVMREHERPRDGFEPISTWLIFLFLAFVGWGGWYLGAYSAGFRFDVFDIVPLHEQGPQSTIDNVEAEVVDPMVLGEEIYSNYAACHQANGQGISGTFPPLIGSERVLGDPRPFAAILLDGLQGPLEVDGVLYDNLMPPWERFDDEEIAVVMTYVRQSWGNDAAPAEARLVGEVRDALIEREEPWTDTELEQFDWEVIDISDDEPTDEQPADEQSSEAESDVESSDESDVDESIEP